MDPLPGHTGAQRVSGHRLLRLLGPKTFDRCVGTAFLSGVFGVGALLFFAIEGLICIAMAIPVIVPLLIFGAALGFAIFHERFLRPSSGAIGSLVLILGLALIEARDRGPAPEFVAADAVVIEASPDRVWSEIVGLRSIPNPSSWVLRSGLACPRTVHIAKAGRGGTRVCTLSTGTMVERIDRWVPGRELHWTALATPPPLEEINPFARVDAPHLHGFMETSRGEFSLESLGGQRTRLTRRTWYRHNLQPAFYWKLWCDFAARRVHRVVLDEIKRLAELSSTGDRVAARPEDRSGS